MTQFPPAVLRILEDARKRGLDVEIRERPAAKNLAEAAAILGITPAEIVKTLVVKRSDGSFVLALVPGGRKISWPKLRAVLGVNKLQLPDAEQAKAATGYERGTITPLGTTKDWPMIADASIGTGQVALGAGAHGYSMFVGAQDLIAALNATVADITEPE